MMQRWDQGHESGARGFPGSAESKTGTADDRMKKKIRESVFRVLPDMVRRCW